MYVTYSDLIQIGIFMVALASLIYEIFKGYGRSCHWQLLPHAWQKSSRHYCNSDG